MQRADQEIEETAVNSTDLPPPPWKFWHPLPFWKMLGVIALANLVATFAVVALREGLHLDVPMYLSGGLGGGLGVAAVSMLARRAKLQQEAEKAPKV